MNKKENIIIKKISKILEVKEKNLMLKKNFSEFKGWDSLKHLEIITFLDEILEKKTKKTKNFSKIKNLEDILFLVK